MSEETKHTKTPWEVALHSDNDTGPIFIVSEHKVMADGRHKANWIAECDLQQEDPSENHANADFIVRACNCFDDLVSALTRDHALLCELRKNLAPGQANEKSVAILGAIEQGSRALNKINE